MSLIQIPSTTPNDTINMNHLAQLIMVLGKGSRRRGVVIKIHYTKSRSILSIAWVFLQQDNLGDWGYNLHKSRRIGSSNPSGYGVLTFVTHNSHCFENDKLVSVSNFSMVNFSADNRTVLSNDIYAFWKFFAWRGSKGWILIDRRCCLRSKRVGFWWWLCLVKTFQELSW